MEKFNTIQNPLLDNFYHFLNLFFEQLTTLLEDLVRAEKAGISCSEGEVWLAHLQSELEIKTTEIKIFLQLPLSLENVTDLIKIWLEVIRPNKIKITLTYKQNFLQNTHPTHQINTNLSLLFSHLAFFKEASYTIYLVESITNLGDIFSNISENEPDFEQFNMYQETLNKLILKIAQDLKQIYDEFEQLHIFYPSLSQAIFLDLWSAVSRLDGEFLEELFKQLLNTPQWGQIKEVSAQTNELRRWIDYIWHTPVLMQRITVNRIN